MKVTKSKARRRRASLKKASVARKRLKHTAYAGREILCRPLGVEIKDTTTSRCLQDVVGLLTLKTAAGLRRGRSYGHLSNAAQAYKYTIYREAVARGSGRTWALVNNAIELSFLGPTDVHVVTNTRMFAENLLRSFRKHEDCWPTDKQRVVVLAYDRRRSTHSAGIIIPARLTKEGTTHEGRPIRITYISPSGESALYDNIRGVHSGVLLDHTLMKHCAENRSNLRYYAKKLFPRKYGINADGIFDVSGTNSIIKRVLSTLHPLHKQSIKRLIEHGKLHSRF